MKKKPSLRSLKNKAWKLCSEYVRRKDADEGGTVSCYTCNKLFHWTDVHAGHAIPGRHNAVLLDVEIIRPQCPTDNLWRGGLYHIFATRLIRENGMDWWEGKLAASRQAVKMTRADYEAKIEEFKQKLKGLELEPA